MAAAAAAEEVDTIVWTPKFSTSRTSFFSIFLLLSLVLSLFLSVAHQTFEFYAKLQPNDVCAPLAFKCQVDRVLIGSHVVGIDSSGMHFWPASQFRCFAVSTALQIIASAATNCLTISPNKPSACHSFDDIFGRLI